MVVNMSKKLIGLNKTLTILLVDDDDGDAKAVQRAFKNAKIANTILRAVDGLEALDMLRGTNSVKKIASPHILLVDLNMPRMNGIELIKTLREDPALKHTISFVLTTSIREEDKIASYDLNVAGYIVKATAGEDFLNLVGLIDHYWRIVEIP